MAHDHDGHDRTLRVLHATAPTCWWSWGFHGAVNRVRAVYGDQVRVETFLGCVYEDLDEYVRHYGTTFEEMQEEARAASETMRVALSDRYTPETMPRSVFPATLAAAAARRQGEDAMERMLRALQHRSVVAMQDVARPEALREAAREARLDLARFERDLADEEGLRGDLERQGEGWPHLPLGFYNLAVTDGHRHVLLDHAFEPADLEGAIEWLSGGTLRKRRPEDVGRYLREHGLVPLAEVERVFALAPKEAEERLEALVAEGAAERVVLAGAAHWRPKGDVA